MKKSDWAKLKDYLRNNTVPIHNPNIAIRVRWFTRETCSSKFYHCLGLIGSISFDEETGFFGTVANVWPVIGFEGKNLMELRKGFRKTVRDHIRLCMKTHTCIEMYRCKRRKRKSKAAAQG